MTEALQRNFFARWCWEEICCAYKNTAKRGI